MFLPVAYKSFVAIDRLQLTYVLGEKTVPKIGLILVFKEYRFALNFVRHYALPDVPYAILEGTVEGPRLLPYLSQDGIEDFTAAEYFWTMYDNGTVVFRSCVTPNGTYGVTSFTPISVVKEYRRRRSS